MTLKLAAAVDPKVTAVAPRKLVPLIITVVPPAVGPDDGFKPVTVGVARYVTRRRATWARCRSGS